MSRCENCIHKEVCNGALLYPKAELNCDHYKDKSLLVELPCRCKDCKHFAEEEIGGTIEYICKAFSGMINIVPDSYCSSANKKLKEIEGK